ncbi:MAG: response regulator transcription factor [Dehalococcoidales bacterium]
MVEEIRIVVADDHVLAREGMRFLFASQGRMTVVAEAVDGVETLDAVERLHPDVLILDVRMPKVNGIEVTRRLKEASSPTRILVVSAYQLDEYVLALMEAGADGYMMKTASPDQLIDAVERVHQGEFVLHPAVAQQMAALWARRRVTEEEVGEKLTARELQVVQLAARGLRNKAIAAELGISVRSVEARFGSVFAKLGVSSRVQAILHALANDLVTVKRDEDSATGGGSSPAGE